MGMNLDGALYLQRGGFLTREKNRLLDIGPQNVYDLTSAQIDEFVQGHGAVVTQTDLDLAKQRLVYFSTPRPEEQTTLLSEITDLIGVEYNSIDVCPGLKTEILDLNFDRLPRRLRRHYDVVMNFGTTEHIFNQWNCFEVIHDAVKVGGVMYHQLPGSGYMDHGYYCYTPLFFKDMAVANGYEVIDLFMHPCSEFWVNRNSLSLRTRDSIFVETPSLEQDDRVPSLNIHVVLRKTRDAKFRTSLEVATSHAPVDASAARRYGSIEPAMARIRRVVRKQLSRVKQFMLRMTRSDL
jgi:ribosome-associated translation inhibitor RaiA